MKCTFALVGNDTSGLKYKDLNTGTKSITVFVSVSDLSFVIVGY